MGFPSNSRELAADLCVVSTGQGTQGKARANSSWEAGEKSTMEWAEGGMGTGWVGWRDLCSHLGWPVGVTVMNKHPLEPKDNSATRSGVSAKEEHGPTGVIPEKGHSNDQRAASSAMRMG